MISLVGEWGDLSLLRIRGERKINMITLRFIFDFILFLFFPHSLLSLSLSLCSVFFFLLLNDDCAPWVAMYDKGHAISHPPLLIIRYELFLEDSKLKLGQKKANKYSLHLCHKTFPSLIMWNGKRNSFLSVKR